MGNWIYMDSEYISPLALLIAGLIMLAMSFLLALIKEIFLHNNQVIYP
jgi:hypothetical protein